MEPNAPTLSRTLPPLATPKQVRMARQPDSPREPPVCRETRTFSTRRSGWTTPRPWAWSSATATPRITLTASRSVRSARRIGTPGAAASTRKTRFRCVPASRDAAIAGWESAAARFTACRMPTRSSVGVSGKRRTVTSARPDDSRPRKTRAERSGSSSSSSPNFPTWSGASQRAQPGGGSGEGSLVAPQEAQSQRSDAMIEVDDPQTIGSLGGPYQKYGPSGGFAKRIRKSESRGLKVRGLRGRDHLVGRAGRFLDLARPFAGRLQVRPKEVRRPQAEALDRRCHPGQRAVQVIGEVPGLAELHLHRPHALLPRPLLDERGIGASQLLLDLGHLLLLIRDQLQRVVDGGLEAVLDLREAGRLVLRLRPDPGVGLGARLVAPDHRVEGGHLALEVFGELLGLPDADLHLAHVLLLRALLDELLLRLVEPAVQLGGLLLALADLQRDRAERLVEAVLEVAGGLGGRPRLRIRVAAVSLLALTLDDPVLDLADAVADRLHPGRDPLGPFLHRRGPRGKARARPVLLGPHRDFHVEDFFLGVREFLGDHGEFAVEAGPQAQDFFVGRGAAAVHVGVVGRLRGFGHVRHGSPPVGWVPLAPLSPVKLELCI